MCCSCWLSVGVMTLHLRVTCMQSCQHVLPVVGPCGQVCAQPQDCIAFYLLITTTMEIKSIKVLCNEFQCMAYMARVTVQHASVAGSRLGRGVDAHRGMNRMQTEGYM